MDASGGVEAGTETAIALGRADGHGGPLRASPAATARTPTRCGRAGRAAQRSSAPRSRRCRWPSARPTRSAATSTWSIARRALSTRAASVTEVPIPADLEAEVARRRDQLLEAAAEADDDVLTKYLEGEEISDAGARGVPPQGRPREHPGAGLLTSAAQRHRHRRRCSTRSSATSPPPPRSRRSRRIDKARHGASRSRCDPAGPLLAQVFKTTADPFVGRLTYFRVCSRHDPLPRPRLERRAGARRSASARCCCSTARTRSRRARSAPARSAPWPSSSHTDTGDSLSARERAARRCPPIEFPEPTLPVAIEPQTKAGPGQAGRGPAPPARGGPERSASSARPRPASSSSGRQGENHDRRRPSSASSASSAPPW